MPANFSHDTLLVTCASGRQASHLIPHLLPNWKHFRLAVRSESSRQSLLKQYTSKPLASAIEVVQADLAQSSDCARILEGMTAVFHVGPPFHARETEIGYNMIDAAVASSVQHFVYSSVLHPVLRKMMNHDCKRYVEEYLIESGLKFTILQPSHVMEMFPIEKLIGEEEPVYEAKWDPEVLFSFTSLDDYGEAAARVLEQRETHYYATYEMVSTSPPMGYRQICEIASEKSGKEIKVEVSPFQEVMNLGKVMSGEGTDRYARDGLQRMLLYYNYRGLVGSTNVMQWLLGRKPTQWEDWIENKINQG